MKTSFKIGSIIGIDVKIHFSFLIILALFVWAFSSESISFFGFVIGFGDLPVSLVAQVILGFITAVLLFVCVLLHELGHSYITQSYGINIDSITLFIFGGVSQSEEIPRDPKKEMTISVTGPAVSIVLGVFFYLLYILIGSINVSLFTNSLFILFSTLAFYNLILAGFNLIPAFPIDGGRVLRAALATKMKYQKATKTAANIGKGIAVAMVFFGILFNFWLILIAIFIYFGASQEQRSSQISLALKGKKVRDIMKKNVRTITSDMSVQKLYDLIKESQQFGFPVVKDDKLIGVVSLTDVKNIDEQQRDQIMVKDIMKKNIKTVSPDEDAFSLFKKILRGGFNRVVVQDGSKVVGILSRNDIIRAIQILDIKD